MIIFKKAQILERIYGETFNERYISNPEDVKDAGIHASILYYVLSQKNIIHNDLNQENVMINERIGEIVFIDPEYWEFK